MIQRNRIRERALRITVQLLRLGAGYLLILLGWLLIYWVLLLPTWVYWFGALVVSGFVFWIGYSTGLFSAAYKIARTLITPKSSTSPESSASSVDLSITPVEIAKIAYTLQDPIDEKAFDIFLDKQRYYLGDNTDVLFSPTEMVETQVLNIIEAFEKSFRGQVSVEAEIHRGSLTIGLSFLVMTYAAVAQYKDFIESVSLARNQLRKTFSIVSDGYRKETSREIQIKTDISIKSKGEVATVRQDTSESDGSGESSYSPITVTNAISPPGGGQPINLNVSFPTRRRSGCMIWISVILLIVIIIIIIGAIIFLQFLEPVTRKIMIDSAIQNVGNAVEGLGNDLRQIGNEIREYQYTGP